jgi:hypothetical protein
MKTDFEDNLKSGCTSLLVGIALPILSVAAALPGLEGGPIKRYKGGPWVTGAPAVSKGLFTLGIGLCCHAFFFRPYENRPILKWTLGALGILMILQRFVYTAIAHAH